MTKKSELRNQLNHIANELRLKCIENVELKKQLQECINQNTTKVIELYKLKSEIKVMRDDLYQWSKVYFYPKDAIVAKVIEAYKTRSEVGIAKYGTTLEDNNTDDFLQHLQEELMDATLYVEKLKENKLQLNK